MADLAYDDGCSIFEYMYRDAGNWKTHGALLLSGAPLESAVRECLEWGDQFVAEQVGVPSLCPEHFAATGEGPSDLDHAYHEFVALRSASVEEVESLPVAGALSDLVKLMLAAKGRWDVRLSPNCE
ncbi:hypothetical protein [Novilysobacter spongiicola]|uniref:Uncharacterized protein n=1 Tax=Lysobacter spongiicola DSM 21749 TaxID=1122188 RepID=A0A1T4R6Q1_9GAMM|nr:hypothetical protein [Lysobacter spongiicola]SKA11762.1 hypothetical protein SAMN02745674_02005 [Lysobacter spongiicola DSM 21749]